MNYLCIQPQTSIYINLLVILINSDEFIGARSFFCVLFKFLYVFVCCRFREKLGVKTVKALKRNNNGVTHAAIDMLCALMCVSVF